MRLALISLAAAACSGPHATPAPSCSDALKAAPERTAMTAACEEDRWPADVRACFAKARAPFDVIACKRKLTVEQVERLDARFPAATTADAMPAAPSDASPPAAIDAASPPVDARTTIHTGPAQPPAAERINCTKQIVDAANAACRLQFCAANPNDARCMLE